MPKQIRLNAFDMSCVGHQSPGLWTHPRDQADRYNTLDYWVQLARLLERGSSTHCFWLMCWVFTTSTKVHLSRR
jgi:hypothetical protein